MQKQISKSLDYVRKCVSTKTVLVLIGGDSSESQGSIDDSRYFVPVIKKYAKKVIVCNPKYQRHKLYVYLQRADLVYVAMYGGYGENGELQSLLNVYNKRFTGAHTLTSAIGMNKYIFKVLMSSWGFSVPVGQRVDIVLADQLSIMARCGYVLKPINEGDSYGIKYFRTKKALFESMSKIKICDRPFWMAEEYVSGVAGTIALIQLGDKIFCGDVVLIKLPPTRKIYDTRLKYFGHHRVSYEVMSPSKIYDKIIADVQRAYRLLECRGVTRFDFIIRNDEIYYIEMNTFPGLYPGSNADLSFRRMFDFDTLVMLNFFTAIDFVATSSTFVFLKK